MLAVDFGGIGANAAEGNQTATNNSFNKFKALYTDVKEACNNCHDSPRTYYVSKDVFAKIDQMGTNITENNMTNVQAIQQELGIQCYRCHVLHIPAQDMKSKMK
jgi:cytochrome c556